ncbi:gamma-type small acid-soluble spore protein [Neobacillus sp. SCS-31]|uniref:gamma-type small acid-soluble spore protein n=1 Tax=Neobacillus oceani TaxID=3115292 RepID=UPI003905EE3D
MEQNKKNLTSVGTDIEEVKRLNAESGLSYNEVKELLAKTGGKGTAMYSDTDVEEVKRQIHPGIEE